MAAHTVRRLGYALGAELRGIDVTGSVGDDTIAGIRQAWLDNVVLCIPGQDMTPASMTAFCARFGKLDDHRHAQDNRHAEYPTLKILHNRPSNDVRAYQGERSGRAWHTDQSYTTNPSVATFLNAKEIPEVGGDTMFTSMYLAYETLSPKLRAMLDGMSCIHDQACDPSWALRNAEQREASRRNNPPVVHSAVRVHPETSRKALYVSPRVRQFLGMTEEESRPLLDFLIAHATRYEFLYRHRWTVGDIVMWDNRAAMHIALQDYDQRQVRRMLRCTGLGPKIGYVYEGENAAAQTPAMAAT